MLLFVLHFWNLRRFSVKIENLWGWIFVAGRIQALRPSQRILPTSETNPYCFHSLPAGVQYVQLSSRAPQYPHRLLQWLLYCPQEFRNHQFSDHASTNNYITLSVQQLFLCGVPARCLWTSEGKFNFHKPWNTRAVPFCILDQPRAASQIVLPVNTATSCSEFAKLLK